MVVALIFTLYFLLLTALEILSALYGDITLGWWTVDGGSVINAFVLGTIAATYLKGAVVKRESYSTVASLLATAFSVLMILAYLASQSISFGVFGFAAAPYFLKKVKK